MSMTATDPRHKPGTDRHARRDEGHGPRGAAAPIRTALVNRVRAEIAAGTYDTPERWDAALDRLFAGLAGR